MRILIFSRAEWDDSRSFGNTFTNLFGGETWKEDQFSNIYMRSAMPRNPVCQDYYQIGIPELFKKEFCREKIGRYFTKEEAEAAQKTESACGSAKKEKKILDILHSLPTGPVYTLCEGMMRRRTWENERFARYLKEFDPDIFMTYLGDDGIIAPMIAAVKNHTRAKIVLYGMDDLYGAIQKFGPVRRRYARKGFREAVAQADFLYGISDELCCNYGRMFHRDFHLLRKGCEFDPLHVKAEGPVRFVYAGNLRYGREETLGKLASVLKSANEMGLPARLEIYTGASVTDKLEKTLNIPGVSQIMGLRPYSEIRRIMNEADVVLEVESFEQKQIDYVRYSFSTKITDCLQSGSVPVAIGPGGVGSMEYMKKIPGAVVIDDPQSLQEDVLRLLRSRVQLPEMAEKARSFAEEHHEIRAVQEKLRRDFLEL